MICTCCEGSGKQNLQVTTIAPGKEDVREGVSIPCIWCKGTGTMSDGQHALWQYYQTIWCECGEVPVSEWDFYELNQHPKMNKEHARHTVCGKVLQIG